MSSVALVQFCIIDKRLECNWLEQEAATARCYHNFCVPSCVAGQHWTGMLEEVETRGTLAKHSMWQDVKHNAFTLVLTDART